MFGPVGAFLRVERHGVSSCRLKTRESAALFERLTGGSAGRLRYAHLAPEQFAKHAQVVDDLLKVTSTAQKENAD